jgi:hypothetical protein
MASVMQGASRQLEAKAGARPEQTKESKMLAILRARSAGLNRFEAEQFGDHCLHSTVASLRRKGYQFHDEWEWTQTRFGDVHVKRYFYLGLQHAGAE